MLRIVFALPLVFFIACQSHSTQVADPDSFPKMGPIEVVRDTVNGEVQIVDTLWHKIPPFSLIDQDSNIVTNATFDDKLYVADFFFTSCPSICPKMKEQMLRIYNRFREDDRVALLSHTIDPKHDTVPVLHAYGEKLGISADKWHLVTGTKEEIYALAKDYFIAVEEDPSVAGGYVHSGGFLMVDWNGHIRGHYDGTKPQAVTELMDDMETLLDGYPKP